MIKYPKETACLLSQSSAQVLSPPENLVWGWLEEMQCELAMPLVWYSSISLEPTR